MSIRTILSFPDPKLRTKAKPVEVFDEALEALVSDMLETMYDAKGIGLAATQIDVHQRVVVMDLSEEGNDPLVLINPSFEVLDPTLFQYDEGCLSVPGFYESVQRPQKVLLKAKNEKGEDYEIEAEGLFAVCIQHELDHLEGILFVDHISNLKRNRIRDKLKKRERQLKRG